MLFYIIKRIFYTVPILFCASVLIFLFLRYGGTDPVTKYLLISNITPTQEMEDLVRHQFGLDKSIFEQFYIWLTNAMRLDFGKSYITGRDVYTDMIYYLPTTLKLSFIGLVITLGISIPLGMLATKYKDKSPDHIIRMISFLGVCVPSFWLGLLLIYIFSIKLNWLPALGMDSPLSMVMPAIAVSFMSMAINTRLLRANMLEVKNQRFITYGKMRGLPNYIISSKYVFCNALLPIVTAIGMHLGELIGGSIIVESIFALPGVGRYTVIAIQNYDYPIIQCFVLMMCFVFIISNLIIDILYMYLDPRIRLISQADGSDV